MSDTSSNSSSNWQDFNNRYLSASLQWLRARLNLLLPTQPPSTEVLAKSDAKQNADIKRLLQKVFGKADVATTTPASTVSTTDTAELAEESGSDSTPKTVSTATLKRRVTDANNAREAAARAPANLPPPALLTLAERFGLSEFERDCLLLAAALEFDPGIGNLYAQLQGGSGRNYPSFSLAMSVLDEPSWDAMSAQRPLRFAHLLEVLISPGQPLTASPLRADERIVNFLKGLNLPDERLRAISQLLPARDYPLAQSQQKTVDELLGKLRQLAGQQAALPVVQLFGSGHGNRVLLAQQACKTLARNLYQLRIEALPAALTEIETLARLWQRESLLLPVALYIDCENLDAPQMALVRHFLAQEVGVVFVGTLDTATPLNGTGLELLAVECNKPTALEQSANWQAQILQINHATPEQAPLIAPQLAGQFDLNFDQINQVCQQVGQVPGPALRDALWDGCGSITRPQLDQLAQRLQAKASWDDLVLPDEQMRIMRQIAAQVRGRHKVYGEWGFTRKMNRGFGISALFAGESGTGKTMAAEVIANALRLQLYRIDLSQVVSKYIGETEKNLRKLFDCAEMGGAILFFDEADALFGKRSEVKDSHDRYANIEINYLLQRMEAFSGLAILATNFKSALDTAFMRRLRFIVQFPFPGAKERLAIWQHALPPEVPTKDLDFTRLAKLNLSGGNIHSIVLNAAFAAAEAGRPIDMALMLASARAELKKLDKPVVESEFRI